MGFVLFLIIRYFRKKIKDIFEDLEKMSISLNAISILEIKLDELFFIYRIANESVSIW